jgi:cytochrome P450
MIVSTRTTVADFPFASAALPLEPPVEFARLREHESVVRVLLPTGDVAWLVTRYDDVRQVYADPRFSRAAAVRPGAPRNNEVGPGPDSIGSKDAPEHARLRRLVAPAFTVRRIEAMRPRIERRVDGLLDAIAAADPPVDLVLGLAIPVTLSVLGDLLGVPDADMSQFRDWSEVFMSISGYPADEVRRAGASFERYVADLVARKRAHPGDDVLSVLVAASGDDRLTEEELINLGVAILIGGFETLSGQISNIVVMLLRHPDQLALLRDDPDLLPGAVEELMRFIPRRRDGGMIRVALEDVELGGVTVRAGEAVIPAIGSADRDPRQFPDPDRLDVTRPATANLAFGHGIHHCLGAHLARLELRVTFAALLRRFPGLHLAVPEDHLRWHIGKSAPSPVALPVSW